jgi:four helix bundle protein
MVFAGLSKKYVMKTYDVSRFNEEMRLRTKMFAVNIYKILEKIRLNDLSRIPVRQLIRSATSVAANFSSATRGRSEAEFYSKVCVVTEECDECLFWLDFLIETGIIPATDIKTLKDEADELLRIFSTIKRKLKLKRPQ